MNTKLAAAERLGWRLGSQAYTFHKFTLFEAIDKIASVGLRYIELYPGQRLSPAKPDVKFDHNAPDELRREVQAKLRAAGLKWTCYGVCRLPNDEKVCRVIFDFAKNMCVETLTAEPSLDAFPLVDKLCNEYGVSVAIHNHPKPSTYWDPDVVLKAIAGTSRRIGVCADTGHWMRCGLNPVECLRKLEGRIVSLHFKDLNSLGEDAHDVVWGTGEADVPALLAELKRQQVRAVFSIEYEYNWENSLPEVAACVDAFDRFTRQLA